MAEKQQPEASSPNDGKSGISDSTGKNSNNKVKQKKLELTEDDIKLKEALELQVQVIIEQKPDDISENAVALQANAIHMLSKEIKSATGTMTALPRPLKFLKAHYKALTAHYQLLSTSHPNHASFANLLSVLAMTSQSDPELREALKFRLEGARSEPIDVWGHEYVRHLAGEIGKEYMAREEKGIGQSELLDLVHQIVPFFFEHNAEFDAVDLLIEIDKISELESLVTKHTYDKVGRYIMRCADYIGDTDEITSMYQLAYRLFLKNNAYTESLRVAIRLDDKELMAGVFAATDDRLTKLQLGFVLGSQKIVLDELRDDDELMETIGNVKLNSYYLQLANDLDVKDPKSPEDIYKSWLEEGGATRRGVLRSAPTSTTGFDSAKQNLAATFVNAFVNAGFCKDLLITPEGSDWLYKNKNHGMLSATASLGLLMLFDVETGFSVVDRYSFSSQPFIKAGSALAHGILSTGITSEMDAAQALLSEHIDAADVDLKVSAILGLGIAYAGSAREDVLEMLVPKIVEDGSTMEVVATTTLALGLVFAGTANEDISGSIIEAFLDRSDTELKDSSARLMCLGLGLLFLGTGDKAEGAMAAIAAIEHPIQKYLLLTVDTCAWAGSSSVLAIQRLLAVAAEHIEEDEADPFKTIHQEVAVLGIATVAMGEDLAQEMALRTLDHVLQYGEVVIRRVVPLALGLLSVCNPRLTVLDTLSKLSHDGDQQVSQNAVLAMGFLGAGTNNARIATLLRGLAGYYAKEPNHLFLVRISQGLLHMGKGLLTLSPNQSDGFLFNKIAMAGLLTVFHASLDLKHTLLDKRHYLLFTLATAIRPRMLMIVDEELKPLPVSVRVGQRVDTVGQAGRPKAITGFQTHETPVLLAVGERAELSTDEYIALSDVLEGVVICKKNPDYVAG